MKARLYLLISSFLLVACSEQVEPVTQEVSKSTVIQVEKTTEESKDILSEASSEIIDHNNQEESIESSASLDEQNNNVSQGSEEIRVKDDFYEYYVEQGTQKTTEETEDSTSKPENTLVYEDVSEGVIELPKLENNKEIILDNIQEITLSDLEKDGIITYIEEPTIAGILIALDLKKLTAIYDGESYSLAFNGNEYGVVVSTKKQNLGVILIPDSKDFLEDIKNNSIFNIIN